MFQLQIAAPSALLLIDLDGHAVTLDLDTLVALSDEGRDARSGQRRPDVVPAAGETLAEVRQTGGGWAVTLGSGRTLTLTSARLAVYRDPGLWRVPPKAWTAVEAERLAVHDYRAFHADDDTKRRALLQLVRHGFVRLSGAPAEPGEIETLVAGFGVVRETNYGRLLDVRTRHNAANLADTALALAPHTDNPYRLSPPELQILHCLSAAGAGGQSLLVDGLAVVEALKAEAPADYDLLCRVPAHFAWSDGETFLEATAPVITPERIRYNPRSFQSVTGDNAAWRRAWARFGDLLAAPAFGLAFDMAPGDMVIMDNRRVLHGRTAFDPTGEVVRHLQGGYADIDGVSSTLRRLTEARVSRDLDGLEALFESETLSQAYGEDISIRDHMLQSAEGAVGRKKGARLVAAALLHDIGWGMAGAHEIAAAGVLAPLVGEGVASLVRNHVAAKRYLVATRPDYAGRLSAASVRTLAQQGGPMSEAECRAFEALPDFELSLELRYLDEGGKALSAPVSRFGDYRDVLTPLMIRQAMSGQAYT